MTTRPESPAEKAGQPDKGVHPQFAAMCRAFSGESVRHAQAANTQQLRAFWVQHKRGFVVERQFEALAADSLAAATDHPAPEGCRCIVQPLEEFRDREQRRGDLNEVDLDAIDREFGIDRRNITRALDQRAPSRGFA